MTDAKKRGRPSKMRGERAATVNLTLRLAPMLLEQLRRSAEVNQRSIAAEAQRRLAQEEIYDVAKMVGIVIGAVEQRSGRRWSEDLEIQTQCRMAAETVLNLVLGAPADLEVLSSDVENMGKRFDKEVAAGGDPIVMQELRDELRRIDRLLEARRLAIDMIKEERRK